MTGEILDLRRAMSSRVARSLSTHTREVVRDVVVRRRHRGLTIQDLLLVSYPKSGSTWLRFVLADLARGRSGAGFTNIDALSPRVGLHKDAPPIVHAGGRLIKSHEEHRVSPIGDAKALVVVRDGRDVAVSLYYFLKRVNVYDGDFGPYLDAFLAGRVLPYGSWHNHTLGWVNFAAVNPSQVVVVRYEDLLTSPISTLQSILHRVGVDYELEAVRQAFEYNNLQEMREKEKSVGQLPPRSMSRNTNTSIPFVRSGSSGQWLKIFDDQMRSKFVGVAGEALRAAGYPAS